MPPQKPFAFTTSIIVFIGLFFVLCAPLDAQARRLSRAQTITGQNAIPLALQIQILRAEDTRDFNAPLQRLLNHANARIRERAALAAGRIGDERAVATLIKLLQQDGELSVRAMAAFALGEIESAAAAEALIQTTESKNLPVLRARSVEALGKIAASIPAKTDEARRSEINRAIIGALNFESGRRSRPDGEVILAAITAALRARPDGAGASLAPFLGYSNARERSDTLNALARLRANDGNAKARELLTQDADPLVRANAARVLGATNDKASFDALLDRALNDMDERVRVSAARALAALKDERTVAPLIARGKVLLANYETVSAAKVDAPTEQNELLEIANALGRIRENSNDENALAWLRAASKAMKWRQPETEAAIARIAPNTYLNALPPFGFFADDWQQQASYYQALQTAAELATADKTKPAPEIDARVVSGLLTMACLKYSRPQCATYSYSIGDGLRAYAAMQPPAGDLRPMVTKILTEGFSTGFGGAPPRGVYTVRDEEGTYSVAKDVTARVVAAEILAALPPDAATVPTLKRAYEIAQFDTLNDATLAVLDALGKQKNAAANEVIKLALASPDYIVKRRAAALLKQNGAGDYTAQTLRVRSQFTTADYRRALLRQNKIVTANVTTDKGEFVIQFNSADAPLTVDNFVRLARSGYFNKVEVHRVVPNFVMQDGDPRGDGNGSPGYQIRCEINLLEYERGAVGMALSGKDTGGSQWFITHSPQPHLDGGYTVFGHVISGMEVVDKITRGDKIRLLTISEK